MVFKKQSKIHKLILGQLEKKDATKLRRNQMHLNTASTGPALGRCLFGDAEENASFDQRDLLSGFDKSAQDIRIKCRLHQKGCKTMTPATVQLAMQPCTTHGCRMPPFFLVLSFRSCDVICFAVGFAAPKNWHIYVAWYKDICITLHRWSLEVYLISCIRNKSD